MTQRVIPFSLVLMIAVTCSPAVAEQDIVDTAVSAGSFNTLVAAVKAAGLVDTLKSNGPFTVFAPTDDAFAKLPAGTVESLLKPENKQQLVDILTYHVIPAKVTAKDAVTASRADTVQGQSVSIDIVDAKLKVNDATIVATDIDCTNGVVHVIDQVILPVANTTNEVTPASAKTEAAPAGNTIVETAIAADGFNTLVAAVKAAGLVDTLQGAGPFTVFAPTDEAFAKLPAGTLESLLKPENKSKLVSILTYHVVPGKVLAADVVKLSQATTVQGSTVSIDASNGVQVNDANVVATDIDCSNGVIHVIDSVILPPEKPRSNASARHIIHNAISRGVPAFNRGYHAQCVDIYTNAIHQLLDDCGDQFPQHGHESLNNALSNAKHSRTMSSRAWALRHGLDAALRMARR